MLNQTLISLVCLSFVGCVDVDDETFGSIDSELALSSWSPSASTGKHAYHSGQIASLNGVTYLVHSSRCGAWSCWGDSKDILWSKLTPSGWTSSATISGQRANSKVSLAPFNGFLYMAHSGESDSTAVWLTRFDPATEQWSTNYKLAVVSQAGPPAMAAFNGRLHFVGSNPDGSMWATSMNTAEVFTPASAIGQRSMSRSSLAVFQNKLHLAHRDNGGTRILHSTSTNGTAWTAPQTIPGGASGVLEGYEPLLAAHDNNLHLVHRRPGSHNVWWTYFNGAWAGEITLNTLTSTVEPSFSNGGSGLALISTTNDTWNGVIESRSLFFSQYASPFAPIDPGPCCIIK